MAKIIGVTAMDGTSVYFHVDRLFGVTAPYKDEKSGETFDCVVALRTVESEKISMLAVKENVAEVLYAWEAALAK